jgi:hypothetical protein
MDFPTILAKIEPKANLRFDLLPFIYQLGSDCGLGTFVHCYEPSRSSSIFVWASNSKTFSERLTALSNFDAKSSPIKTALAESLGWTYRGAVGERPEKELIASFVDKIAALPPQLVTFNGSSFDLPVLRYRAMVHGVAAPGLVARPYFHRYTEDAVDLCDVLASFSPQAKATLHELCRVMGLPGKPDGMTGAEVETTVTSEKLPSTARATFSIPIACGCVTSCFADDCQTPNFGRASLILPIS